MLRSPCHGDRERPEILPRPVDAPLQGRVPAAPPRVGHTRAVARKNEIEAALFSETRHLLVKRHIGKYVPTERARIAPAPTHVGVGEIKAEMDEFGHTRNLYQQKGSGAPIGNGFAAEAGSKGKQVRAPVEHHVGAGQEPGAALRQEGNQFSQLLGLPDALQRNGARDVPHGLLGR